MEEVINGRNPTEDINSNKDNKCSCMTGELKNDKDSLLQPQEGSKSENVRFKRQLVLHLFIIIAVSLLVNKFVFVNVP